MGIHLTGKEFAKRSRAVHGDKYDYFGAEKSYVTVKVKVPIYCHKHNEVYFQRPEYHMAGSGCPKCAIEKNADEKRVKKEELMREFRAIHQQKYDYFAALLAYKNNKSKLPIYCYKHDKVFFQNANCHKGGSGCPSCGFETTADKRKLGSTELINRAKKVHHDRYDYFCVPFSLINTYNENPIYCHKCDSVFFQSMMHHIHSSNGCPTCRQSKGELKIERFLKGENISYRRQVKFDECRNKHCLPFDFYIPRYNILIEYDGSQHLKGWNSGDGSLEKTQVRDGIKNKFASLPTSPLLIRVGAKRDQNGKVYVEPFETSISQIRGILRVVEKAIKNQKENING